MVNLLSDLEKSEIQTKIQEIETKTSAEFVVAITHSSSAAGLYRLFCTTLTFLALSAFTQIIVAALGNTSSYMHLALTLLVPALLALPVGLWMATLGWPFRFFHNSQELMAASLLKAESVFYRSAIHKTKDSTGILLFLSELEHCAVILVDEHIETVFSQEELNEQVRVVIKAIRSKQASKGILEVLDFFSTRLAEVRPPIQDKNELPNHVAVISPGLNVNF